MRDKEIKIASTYKPFFHFGSIYASTVAKANAEAACPDGNEYPRGNPPTTMAASSADDGRSRATRGFMMSSVRLHVIPPASPRGINNRWSFDSSFKTRIAPRINHTIPATPIPDKKSAK